MILKKPLYKLGFQWHIVFCQSKWTYEKLRYEFVLCFKILL